MYEQSMQIQDDGYVSAFQIMVDQSSMVQSYVMEGQKIKFPGVDLVVDQHGINKISDPLTQFNRIKIQPKSIKELEILGKGSAGVVRRAVYELNGKLYNFAVKSINAAQQEHRKQLLNDLRSYLSGGNSEYLTQFYTCFFHNGLVKQVIQYMDMGALRNVIQLVSAKKLKLTEEQMASIIFKILNGLYYIHEARHQIHRDIKPENILFNSKGEVKITDFGVSKCIQHSMGRSMVGTVTYMSPQRLSLTETYTYKCDIWSVGLILFQLATGRQIPYSQLQGRFNYFIVCQKIINEQPPQLPPNVFSPQMNDFIKRCLQKKQEQRSSAKGLLNHPWILSKAGKGSLRDLVQRIQLIK